MKKVNNKELELSRNLGKKNVDSLEIKYIAENDDNIDRAGSRIIVANKTYGLEEGIIIGSIICDIRKEKKMSRKR